MLKIKIKIIKIIPYLRYIWNFKVSKINPKSGVGTPVAVIDMKISKRLEFSSISEAARYFNTYPKTIWRIVYGHKLYHNRYKIIVKNTKLEAFIIKYKYLYYENCIKYLIFINKNIIKNSYLILCIFLWVILIIILCVYFYYIAIIYIEVLNDYVYNIHNIRINHSKYWLDYDSGSVSSLLNNRPNNYKFKISRFIEVNRDLKVNAKLGIYQSIIQGIKLDFSSMTYSVHPSPIVEQIDLNSIFKTMIINTSSIIELIDNSTLSTTKNSLTLNTSIDLFQDQPRGKELLNYQSNILYILINNLSPSIY